MLHRLSDLALAFLLVLAIAWTVGLSGCAAPEFQEGPQSLPYEVGCKGPHPILLVEVSKPGTLLIPLEQFKGVDCGAGV